MWRLDCRLKYVWYLSVIKCVIFSYFWGKMHLFLGSLWRAMQTDGELSVFSLCFIWWFNHHPKKQHWITLERFAWRLDCRLKYVCYLLVIKFVILDHFWGKMYLFLGSLWRALQSGNSPESFRRQFLILLINNTKTDIVNQDREVCVTVGLSSEVYLLPTTNKICDFWIFLG